MPRDLVADLAQPDITVAIADIDDVDDLCTLRSTWHPASDDTNTAFRIEFADWVAKESEQRIFLIARRQGEPIGIVNLLLFDRMPAPGRPSGGWCYLSNMFVVEHERNNGVGAHLIDALIDHADGLELERIVLKPSSRSMPFYLRNGFATADELLVRHRLVRT